MPLVPALPPTPPALAAPARPVAGRAPAYLLVYAREFRLNLSRKVVPEGVVVIQVSNIGEDLHDVAVRNARGVTIRSTPIIKANGGRAQMRLRLKRGRYTLWCRVAGHLEHGMSATFVVKVPARRR